MRGWKSCLIEKKKKERKKIQGAALKPARGKRPWTGLQNCVLFCRRRRQEGKVKKYYRKEVKEDGLCS